jgi:5-methylcytosine-specific restriction enzyme A
MPKAALRPCRKPGCPALVGSGYCDDHTDLSKQADRYRGTAASRGYDADWRRVRLQALKRDNYLCVHCLAAGRVTSAFDVDHIIALCDGDGVGLEGPGDAGGPGCVIEELD